MEIVPPIHFTNVANPGRRRDGGCGDPSHASMIQPRNRSYKGLTFIWRHELPLQLTSDRPE